MKSLSKIIFIWLAYLNIALGVAGMFLPLLPTTPFLLLATILLTKSKPGSAEKLADNRYIGVYIRSYLHGEKLPIKDKVRMITIVCVTMTLSIIFATDNLYVRIALAAISIAVSVHIIMLKPKARTKQ